MTNRRILTVMILALIIASAAIAWASIERAGGANSYTQDRQAFTYWGKSESTSKKQWDALGAPAFGAGAVVSQGLATALVSVKAHGAPVAVRLLWDGAPSFRPQGAIFSPAGSDASTFAFVLPDSQAPDCHHFTTEFKSPTGRKTTITAINVVLDYQQGEQTPGPITPCE